MQPVHGKNTEHVEETELDSFVTKMKSPFLSSEDRLIQFSQVLDVHRLLASFLLIEVEFIDEFPDTLDPVSSECRLTVNDLPH
jgi:hypothetical protein